MLNRPRFRPHLHVKVLPGEGVFLLSNSRQTLLRGQVYELIVPWLDGRTADDVCRVLAGKASSAKVYYALAQLERKDFLSESDGAFPAEQAALWSSLGIEPSVAAQRLAQRPVVVRSFGEDVGQFADLLRSLQVRVKDGGPADVVLVDSYLRPELKDCNAEALREGKPWLLFKPGGRQIWLGPLFRPGTTGCWRCLMQRQLSNSPIENYLYSKNGSAGSLVIDHARSPATMQIGLGLAANAVATWIVTGAMQELEGKLQTFTVPSLQFQTHTLVRLPFCSECGQSTNQQILPFQPPALENRRKAFTNDGGHRVVPPEETLARYSHHVSPITGAVPMLERADIPGEGILHVYVAGNNMARPHHDLAHLRGDFRSLSAGKGVTDVQARASALCEGLERYSGVFRGDEPRRRARMNELGDAAISLHDCLLFSDSQYRERDLRNAVRSRFSFIPVPFDPAAEVEWSPVWSLTRKEMRYLPTAFCYYEYPRVDEPAYCIACSNGNAAGNTLEEAVLQGFLELVERDSVALWWYNRVRRPGVELDTFQEPYLDRLRGFFDEHGCEFWAIDLTADLGVPVFASICRRIDRPPQQIVLGFGAHIEPRIALLRAVTEMNQMLSSPLLKPEAERTTDENTDPETAHWLETATTENQPYLLPADGPRRTASSYPRTWTEELTADVRSCQSLVEKAGLEMLVLDQTRPEIGLPVVKVIVPGLRHFWARFAPGRLYDVPVRLGWLDKPVAEADLNPVPMFL